MMSDFLPSDMTGNKSIDISTDQKKLEAKKGVLIAMRSVFNVMMRKIDQGGSIKFTDLKSIVKESLQEAENVKAIGNLDSIKLINQENENSNT